ncbi:centrosomal protein of 152 kDa-like [Acanthaster planci]|uniref:Centrosomal protein of 152 kDa-like n=1 Tax=Acanthaster planci TaxID=133434 RepID=A0A8B7YBS3_ACAPL|nr:centrosomal protein of 152 kDa-like [Acanthaster planci]
MNPGTSLHFDGQALEEQEEAELEQEDLRREHELRELLTNALPDDLLDDDTASFSSHESNGSLSQRHESPPSPSHDPWSHLRHQMPGHHKLVQQQQQQTSTPNLFSNPPPLKTPASTPYQNGYREHPGNGQDGEPFVQSSDEETLGQQYERGEIEGAASDEIHLQRQNKGHQVPSHAQQDLNSHGNQGQFQSNGYAQGNLHGNRPMTHGYGSQGDHCDYQTAHGTNGYSEEGFSREYAEGDHMQNGSFENNFEKQTLQNGDYEYQDQMHDNRVQQYSPSRAYTQQYSPSRPHVNTNNRPALQQARKPPTYARDLHQGGHPANKNDPAVHRVQYRGDGATATYVNQQEAMQHGMQAINGFPAVTSHAAVGFAEPDAGDQLQKQFLGVGGDEETRQMAQLQILYKARGRELDQLRGQLQVLKEESAREKRIMNHQLALAQGERAGAAASYEQCQDLLAEAQQENSTLKGQLQASQAQIQVLNVAKHEVEEKLQSTQSAIDSLTGQLTELQRSQPLARAREQQDGLLKSLQDRYEQEVTRLKEKVDSGDRALEEKTNEIASLRRELSGVSRAAEQAKLEQGNTINALTNQLQQSQKQCRELLETGSLQEINLLRVQLQEAAAARTFSQDMTSALQEELSEMKEELQRYESAMELGVGATKSPESAHKSKSFAVRNLAKSDWKTPQSQGPSSDSTPKLSPEDLVQGLRRELERALQSNRAKRTQVSKLQTDLRAAKTEMEGVRARLLESETAAKDHEVRFKVLEAQLETTKTSPAGESTSSRHLTEEIDKLQTEKEDLAKTLEAARAEEGRLNEANSDLKKQMAQMVSEWDQDKKVDLERVQTTCLRHHEDSSRHLREELMAEFQSERDMLKEAHQHQLQELRSELEQVQKELDAVKELYIAVCEEKNCIEDTVSKTLKLEAAKQLERANEEWQAQHDAALQELQESLQSSHRAALVTAKSAWKQEAEDEDKKTVEEQLAQAKVEWSEAARKEFVKSALLAAESEWKVKLEAELEERVEQAKKDLGSRHQEQLSQQEQQLQAEHEADKAAAIQMALADAKTEWTKATEASDKEKMKRAIEIAREQWMQEGRGVIFKFSKPIREQSFTSIRLKPSVGQRVAERTKALEVKHLMDITNLQAVLEQARQTMRQEAQAERLAALEEVETRLEREHRLGIEEALRAAREEADRDKSQSLERACSEWQSRLDEEVSGRRDAVNKAVQDAQDRWQKEKQEMMDASKKAAASLKAESEAEQTELRSHYEVELERGIEEAVRAAREQWSQNCESELRKACDEILERKEQLWKKERADLREQLQESATQLRDHRRQAERHRRKHAVARQRLETEIAALREQLGDAEREARQTEYGLRRELERLQSRLREASEAAVEVLERKMDGMRRRHEEELEAATRQRGGGEKMIDAKTQTAASNEDGMSSEALQEIKAHYIRTVKKIKVDVMKRMSDMRESCRHTVHTEVMKERHNTAKKLRRYYLQCLQQFLEEDQNQAGNDNTKAQSTASKLAAMAKALELSPDELTLKLPHPVTSAPLASRGGDKDSGPAESSDTVDTKTATEGKRHHSHRTVESQGPTAKVRQLYDFEKNVTAPSSSGLRNLESDEVTTSSSTDSSVDPTSSRISFDEVSPAFLGSSWEENETGITLRKLPITKEFSPRPERLPAKSHSQVAETSLPTISSISSGSVAVSSRESSPDKSASGIRKVMPDSSSSSRSTTLKSRESSPDSSPVGKSMGPLKGQDGFSGAVHRNITSRQQRSNAVTVRSRESSPETSGSPALRKPQAKNYPATSKSNPNITMRSRKSEKTSTISQDGNASQHSAFMRPISDKTGTESRKGPVKVPPPTEKTAAMLASLSVATARPVPQVTRHTQIPSPGPYKATDTSIGSLDTVYNDLPASLGTIPDFTLDNHQDFPLDKVVRFDEPPKGGSDKKSYVELENNRLKLSTISVTRKINGISSLPSRIDIGSKARTLRSSDKLAYLLGQDSGFESPQLEEQI